MSHNPTAFKNQSRKIMDYYGVRRAAGEVGLELEVIGINLPAAMQKTTLWTAHRDDSVRPRAGEQALEYSLRQPVSREKIDKALKELLGEFKLNNAVPAEGRVSNSVHVHLNAQQLTFQEVYTWLTVYFILEDLLMEFAGPERRGNLFCLRAKDANYLVRTLVEAAENDAFIALNNDNLRYSAANVVALGKFGSIEFRGMRGTANDETISTWVKILLAIKDTAKEYKDPVGVILDFSHRGPRGFIEYVFKEENLRKIFLSMDNIDNRIYDGLTFAQELAFSTKWLSQTVPDKNAKVTKGNEDLGAFEFVVNIEAQPAVDIDDFGALLGDQLADQPVRAARDGPLRRWAFPAPQLNARRDNLDNRRFTGVWSQVRNRFIMSDAPGAATYRLSEALKRRLRDMGNDVQWLVRPDDHDLTLNIVNEAGRIIRPVLGEELLVAD